MTLMERIKTEGLSERDQRELGATMYRGIPLSELTIDQLRFALLDTHRRSEEWQAKALNAVLNPF